LAIVLSNLAAIRFESVRGIQTHDSSENFGESLAGGYDGNRIRMRRSRRPIGGGDEAFLDGHVSAFSFFDGLPHSILPVPVAGSFEALNAKLEADYLSESFGHFRDCWCPRSRPLRTPRRRFTLRIWFGFGGNPFKAKRYGLPVRHEFPLDEGQVQRMA
jgi:hypothetical protein